MTRSEGPYGGFRWTCPYCGKSQLNRSAGDAGESNAIAALRNHIVATAGKGHGPVDELPEGDDSSSLAAHVDEVRERRGAEEARD